MLEEGQLQALRGGERRHTLALIDGPNMSNLGHRSKRIYGSIESLNDLHEYVGNFASALGIDLRIFSSNYEGAILEFIHETEDEVDGYVINPAGMTVASEAARHALEETERPTIEVHFANIMAAGGEHGRGLIVGPWKSRFTPTMTGVMMGLRQYSYLAAVLSLTLALDDEAFLGADLPSGD